MATETLTATSYPTAYETSGTISGTRYQNAIGKGSDTSAVSGNDYASGGSSSKAYIYYSFDFSAIPDSATIDSVACTVKGHAENTSRSTCNVQLYVGTSTAKGSSSKFTSTSAQVLTLTTGTWTVAEVKDMRLRFEIGYYGGLINGATVTVTYTFNATKWTITVSNSTSVEVTASDTEVYDGGSVTITAATLAGIAITDNGTDVTSSFVQAPDATVEQVPDATIDTEFSDSGGAFYISSSSSTTDYLEYACGHSAESPGTATSTNTYVKGNASGNTTTGTVIYSFDFSEIPASATIVDVEVRAYCARENSTIDSTHVCRAAVYSGSTLKGAEQDVSGTDYHIHTMSNVGTWTWAELQSATFHFTLGYYGGRIAGITFEVSYEVDGYVYTIGNVVADHAIVVSATSVTALYVKQGSSWATVRQAYVKRSGAWQAVALDAAFDATKRYRRG